MQTGKAADAHPRAQSQSRPSRLAAFFIPAAIFLVLLSLGVHWNDALLGAHHHRQAQTAQNIEMYLLTGWNPLRNVGRFIPHPGIFLLELPLYQTAAWALIKATALSIEQAARLVSALCGLAFAWGVVVFYGELARGLGVLDVAAPGLAWPQGRARDGAFALTLSLPLLFGLSQWVLPDLIGCAFGVWALVFFARMGRTDSGRSGLGAALAHAALLAASFWIKPTFFVASLPFYALLGVSAPRARRAWAARSLAMACGVGAGLIWFAYAHEVNKRFGSPFKVSDTAYYFGALLKNPAALGRLPGRILTYVIGPGTLAMLASVWIGLPRARRWRCPRALWLAALASGAIYGTAFLMLNVRHSYYQLPFLLPTGLLLCWLLAELASSTPLWPAFVVPAILLNVATAETRLLFVDADYARLMKDAQAAIPAGIDRTDVAFIGDTDLGAALAFYLHRWVLEHDPAELASRAGLKSGEWIATCDTRLDDGCSKAVSAAVPRCAGAAVSYGPYWVCRSDQADKTR